MKLGCGLFAKNSFVDTSLSTFYKKKGHRAAQATSKQYGQVSD